MNQLINQAPNLHYMTGGVARVPVVIRTRVGDGPYGGHPQDYSAWFAYVPGLKVVMPATPADAKGLMTGRHPRRQPGALRRADVAGARPARRGAGRRDARADRTARIAREGTDVTIVAMGSTVPVALRAAATLAEEGVEAEVSTCARWRRWTPTPSCRRCARPAAW